MAIRPILMAAVAALVLQVPGAKADSPTAPVQIAQAEQGNPNRFNRLMKSSGVDANASPMHDGIHDATNPGTEALQPPREAFDSLPKTNSGNRIDWVKALQSGAIEPRVDLADPNKQKQLMDLDIIREVKGSMPDVVYPHKQHTEWLDCAQCHPKLFVPKKGANAISMAAILMGQYCGACHGKVAFPVSDCTKCHSKPKAPGHTTARNDVNPAVTPASAAPATPPAPVAAPQAAVAVAAVAAPAPAKAAGAPTKDQLMTQGAAVYAENCSGCHGDEGEGVPDTFPALKGSKVVKGPIGPYLKVVLEGRDETAMQAWADSLSDDEIAAVATFKRNSWGNNVGDIIQPSAVKAMRK